ncbi:uncharacterized protein LOC124722249 [Schistocerca piceifrons]|uniref:uncharacterized protein LOC124722249 n=1 Tax=Schistocerca piceifrons TaxID=274613 RepID=UPI001F5F0AEC|nr:uncharacterized protein LOC124722249 [Schistocerca piceifrons]
MSVDKQLYPCKCRCPCMQYMSRTPDEHWIKYYFLCVADKRYFLNGFPYRGKIATCDPSKHLDHHVVMNLGQPFLCCGRNITTDNLFASLKLADELKQKGTSLIGTLWTSLKEVPPAVRGGDDVFYVTHL